MYPRESCKRKIC